MKALILVALLAADAGVPEDAPVEARVMRLPGNNYLFNEPAFVQVDSELRRLQALEREHKGESWLGVLLVGMGTGALMTLVTVLTIQWVTRPAPAAGPPSP